MKKSWASLVIGAAAVIMLVSPVSAHAGLLRFWMDEFKADSLPLHGETTTLVIQQNPYSARLFPIANKTTWVGWVPVKLPVGTTIKRVAFIHGGGGTSAACYFFRVKFGGDPELIAIAGGSPAGVTVIPLSVVAQSKLAIAQGYRYFVMVEISVSASVRGVKIVY